MSTINLPQSKIAKFLFTDTRLAGLWLLLRLYIGYEWLMAGWGKLTDENGVWIGAKAGTAINGFFIAALKKASGEHPAVSGWYAWFIENIALQHTVIFSYLIVFGEIAVGLGLIVGLFTALAAFFGAFMNFNFLCTNIWLNVILKWYHQLTQTKLVLNANIMCLSNFLILNGLSKC